MTAAWDAGISFAHSAERRARASRSEAWTRSRHGDGTLARPPLTAMGPSRDPRPHPRYARSSSAISSFTILSRASVTRFDRAGSRSLISRSRTAGTTCHLSP